jgi:L-lactate dehydrogenase complex protein LldG
MSEAREEILARIRGALRDVPEQESADLLPVPRDYRMRGRRSTDELIELLADRVRDYHAEVKVLGGDEVSEAVSGACVEHGLKQLVVPAALPRRWWPENAQVITDDGLSARELDQIDGALTGCASAIAETGTLVFDGRASSGRRAVTLVPDHHICVVEASQIVELVPEAVAATAAAAQERMPITLVSGPSASSDIELSRVEGVHGPRQLLVLIARAQPG